MFFDSLTSENVSKTLFFFPGSYGLHNDRKEVTLCINHLIIENGEIK